jgi:hypothetical protein
MQWNTAVQAARGQRRCADLCVCQRSFLSTKCTSDFKYMTADTVTVNGDGRAMLHNSRNAYKHRLSTNLIKVRYTDDSSSAERYTSTTVAPMCVKCTRVIIVNQ